MRFNTTSEVISFSRRLEDESAVFYQTLSRRFPQEGSDLSSFVKENKKNITQVERSYHGVITDAIEGCFAFDLDPEEYELEPELLEYTNFPEAIDCAIKIEHKIKSFYESAAEQSKSLMADVPRAFLMVAKKRNERISRLKMLKS
jgi:rubrerythrin